MRRTLSRAVALAGLLAGSAAVAQQPGPGLPAPRIAAVFPPGAKAGTAVEVTVSGTDLDAEAPQLLFSDPKVTAVYVPPPEPPADPKAKDKEKKPAPAMGKKKGAPTASHKFKVTVAADAKPGAADARVSTEAGVSNPRLFVVGTLPEENEKEPNNDVPEAQKVELGTVVNGVIAAATDVDYVKFAGKAGQRVLAHCATSSIDSRARPQVEVYAPDGRLLAVNRMYSGNDALADCVLPTDGEYLVRVAEFAYQFGGPEYFYRLTISAGPWVDAVYPPVVAAGKPTPVTVIGRNLANGQPIAGTGTNGKPPLQSVTATVTPPADRTALSLPGRVAPSTGTLDGFAYTFPGANPVPVFLADGPVVLEADKPNDTLETAQEFAAPADVVGRIERQYDRDFYKFAAKKGDTLFVELFADRIGSQMDTYFSVRTEKGQPVAEELDDDTDPLHPTAFYTRSGDPPAYRFTAKEDGTYVVLVGSREANVTHGPRAAYRLRVGKPAPDFRAVVMARTRDLPAAVVGLADGDIPLDVFVDRRDGFAGPVTATAEKLPPGVTAKPALIGSGAKWGTLVLSVSKDAKEFTGPIAVTCAATVSDKPVSRAARPASVTWGFAPGQGNNAPAVSRLDRELVIAVRPAEKAKLGLALDLAAAKVKSKDKDGKEKEDAAGSPLFVRPGDKLTLPVKLTWADAEPRANPVAVALEPTHGGPNAGQNAPLTVNNNQPVQVPKDKADAPVVIDVKPTAPPGTYAVTLRGETQVQLVRDPAQKDKKTAATVTAFAAPVEVIVLPTSLGKFTAAPGAEALKPGGSAEIVVKVERQHDYAGPFQVTLTFPKDAAGLTAKAVTLPAGADEVKVPVSAAADAKPGQAATVVSATATVHGKVPVTHEAKVTLTVAKAK